MAGLGISQPSLLCYLQGGLRGTTLGGTRLSEWPQLAQ